ncbi:MAG: HAD-IIB family hydrolase, partial [Bacilli bacterium]|nr:HAD-IIB family hydrolase [Bacilli bacterium]
MKIKKLIAVDLDGTLLPRGESELSAFSREFLQKLPEEYRLVLISGRPYRAMEKTIKSLGKSAPFVCYNGQEIHYPYPHEKEQIVRYSFPLRSVYRFLEKIEGHIELVQAENEDGIFYSEKDLFLQRYFPIFNMPEEEGEVKTLLQDNPMSVVIRHKDEEFPYLLKAAEEEEGISLRHWNTCPYSELYIPGINKGSALRTIKERFRLKKKDVIAFGDGDNDYEMLLEAGEAYAMKDSP